MATTIVRGRPGFVALLHAATLAGASALFVCTLLADYAYWTSFQIDWSNFASWLLIGAMLLASLALLCEFIAPVGGRRRVAYLLLLAAIWGVGFFDALHHARDAFAIMPVALVLSAIVTVLALLATSIAFAALRAGGAR